MKANERTKMERESTMDSLRMGERAGESREFQLPRRFSKEVVAIFLLLNSTQIERFNLNLCIFFLKRPTTLLTQLKL